MSSNIEKSGEDVKNEILTGVDSYIKGFDKVEPDSDYFNGYRAGLKAVRETIDRVQTEHEIDSKKKEEPKSDKPKDKPGGSSKVRIL